MAKQERIGDWLVHPAASLFPLLEGEQYEQLKASIRVHGLKESIVVKDGVLWDGRNRGKACLELGIDPPTVVYTGSLSAEQYIIDANILRRNLTDDQRLALYSMLLSRIEAQSKGGRGHKSQEPDRHKRTAAGRLAERSQQSRYRAEQMLAVAKTDPALARRVASGQVPLKDAHRQAKALKIPNIRAVHSSLPRIPATLRLDTKAKRHIQKPHEKNKQAETRRMISSISRVRGLCRGIATLKVAWIAPCLTAEDKRGWARISQDISHVMRDFARQLKTA